MNLLNISKAKQIQKKIEKLQREQDKLLDPYIKNLSEYTDEEVDHFISILPPGFHRSEFRHERLKRKK